MANEKAQAAAFLQKMLSDPNSSPLAATAATAPAGGASAGAAGPRPRFEGVRPKVVIAAASVVKQPNSKKGHGDFEVQCKLDGDDMSSWVSHKRYSDFRAIRQSPELKAIPGFERHAAKTFPWRRATMNTSKAVIEGRRQALETFMAGALAMPAVADTAVVQRFLGLDGPPTFGVDRSPDMLLHAARQGDLAVVTQLVGDGE
eukprot:SAG22_NODE_5525_length_999_cov_1.354444_1_plen_202_part_00